jgi:hypothetical protein
MMVAASRFLMALAACCLGRHRREWALAMQVEFEEALEDGKPLTFAMGCFVGVCREIPGHREGRFALASHAIALGLIIPIAALLISGPLFGFSLLHSGHAPLHGMLDGAGAQLLLNQSTRGAAPALVLLILSLTAGHLAIAWAMLDRNWNGVALVARLNAAATVTLIVVAGVLFLDEAWVSLPVAGLLVELAAVSSLMRWSATLGTDMPLIAQDL